MYVLFENTSLTATSSQLLPDTHILYVTRLHVGETGSVIMPNRKITVYLEIWH